jgi:phosphoribosylaminoimidazolecarboxamide formyltransferase/IMP cyclohydrolase
VRAVLSVWDKTGLAEFAGGLAALGWELVSTGRTQQALEAAGVPVTSVADMIGFPEILDGRVKTLHPRLHGGILARRDLPAHRRELEAHGIEPVDLVVSNLYPFVETIAARPLPGGDLAREGDLAPAIQEAIEQIDIGGPTLTRAAAKNFEHVVIVTDPGDYAAVLDAFRAGSVPRAMRARLAQKAFQHTAQYDAYVAQYFAAANGDAFAERVSLPLTRTPLELGYGENPHQRAAFYRFADPRLAGPSLADLEQLHGETLSYNNLLDLDNAYAIVADIDEPAVAIVKHNNPCGVGTGATITEAYKRAHAGDPLSAHGGVVAANRSVGGPMAEAMAGTLYWVIVAPEYTENAIKVFTARRRSTGEFLRSTRVFKLPLPQPDAPTPRLPGFALQYRPVMGGFLAQTPDVVPASAVRFTPASARALTPEEEADLRFAWRVVKHVKSNASVFARNGSVVAVGAGQMSRVDSVKAAIQVARRTLENALKETGGSEVDGRTVERPFVGCVMATDGFFADPDAVEAAAEAGATAIAHPGGGMYDQKAAAAADRFGVAMVTTGYRHFRH